jgi:hypothetical protein
MAFTLKLHGVIVGRSELEHRDAAAHLRWGSFRSGAGYTLVEPVFALRASPQDAGRYRKAREALELELFDANGAPIATSALEIVPDGQTPGGLLLRTRIDDASFWG